MDDRKSAAPGPAAQSKASKTSAEQQLSKASFTGGVCCRALVQPAGSFPDAAAWRVAV